LGAQAAIAVTAVYCRKRTTDNVVTTSPLQLGPVAITQSRFDTIADTIDGFGDLAPQFSLRWSAGVHNVMTYVTGHSGRRLRPLAPFQCRHRARRVRRRRRLHLLQRADGIRIFGGGGADLQLHQSLHPISERHRRASRLGSLALPDQAAADRRGGLSLQPGELRWRLRRPRRLLPVAGCRRRRATRLYRSDGRGRRERERKSL